MNPRISNRPPDEQDTIPFDPVAVHAGTAQAPPIRRPAEAITEPMPIISRPDVDPPAPSVEPDPIPTPDPPDTGDSEPTPDTDPDDDLAAKLSYQIGDATRGVQALAHDHTIRIESEKTTQGRWKFLKKIWYGNLSRDYHTIKNDHKNTEALVQQGHLHFVGGNLEQSKAQLAEGIDRFSKGLLREGLEKDTYERLDSTESGRAIDAEIKAVLISHGTSDAFDEASFKQDTDRILAKYKKQLRIEDRSRGQVLADNLVEVVKNVRAASEAGYGVDRIEAAIQGFTGELKIGPNTEKRRDLNDRILDVVHKYTGGIANEASVVTATSIAIVASKILTKKTLSATLTFAGLGLGSSVFAASREYAKQGDERVVNARDLALGGQIMPGSKRRERLAETRYSSVKADDLVEQLEDARRKIAEASPVSTKNAMETIMGIQARIDLADRENIDLIDFNGLLTQESVRLVLMSKLVESRMEMKHFLESASDEDLSRLGVNRDFERVVAEGVEHFQSVFKQDIAAKDKIFSAQRRRAARNMGLFALVAGATLGEAIQESHALIDDSLFGGTIRSIFEHPASPDRQTLIEGLFGHQSVHEILKGHHNGGDPQFKLSSDKLVNLPAGLHIKAIGHDHFDILNEKGHHLINDLSLDKDGNFSEASRHALENSGFIGTSHAHEFLTKSVEYRTAERTPANYIAAHPHEFTTVDRQLWYNDNSPGVSIDNELKLLWGGKDGSGYDGHGNIVMNASEMTPNGSFADGFSANAQQLIHEHKLFLALSINEGTQAHVIKIPIDGAGNAVISEHSFAGLNLFKDVDGRAEFTGAYAEVDQLMGTHHGVDTVRMLATAVGQNNIEHVTDHIPHLVDHHIEGRIFDIKYNPEHLGSHEVPIEIPLVIPIYGRSGLELITRGDEFDIDPLGGDDPSGRDPGYYNRYYGAAEDDEGVRVRASERSPRLVDNPRARLNPGQEISDYRQRLTESDPKKSKYVEAIERAISRNPALMEIDNTTEAIVCIPVQASVEADNIYRTLRQYSKAVQDPENVSQTKVLLHVNWVDDELNDPEKRANILRTRSEIIRAMKDFPDLRIAHISTQWKKSDIERRGAIVDRMAQKLFDTALIALDQAKKDGRQDPDKETLIIRNDSDARALGSHYLRNMIRAMHDNPNTDAFVGSVRWQMDEFKDYPGLAVITTFREVIHAISGRAGMKVPTIGINTAIKSSSLAAIGCLNNVHWHTAGADDIEIGKRIYAARSGEVIGSASGNSSYYSGSSAIPASISSATDDEGKPYQPIKAIGAAMIDTDNGRLKKKYRSGISITEAWNGFEKENRENSEDDERNFKFGPEDPVRDIDNITARVESELSAQSNRWFGGVGNRKLVELALRIMIPEQSRGGKNIYTLNNVTVRGDDGKEHKEVQFKFTDEGKTVFQEFIIKHFSSDRVRKINYEEPIMGKPHLIA